MKFGAPALLLVLLTSCAPVSSQLQKTQRKAETVAANVQQTTAEGVQSAQRKTRSVWNRITGWFGRTFAGQPDDTAASPPPRRARSRANTSTTTAVFDTYSPPQVGSSQ